MTNLSRRRWWVRAQTAAACLLSLFAACVFIRLMLDQSDARPYNGDETELGYILIAVAALAIWIGGSVCSIILGVRAIRRAKSAGH